MTGVDFGGGIDLGEEQLVSIGFSNTVCRFRRGKISSHSANAIALRA